MDGPGERANSSSTDPFADGQLARAVLDDLPVAMWLKDLDGRFRACNRRFEQLLGVVESDLVGRPSADFVDAETDDVFRRQDRLAVSIGRPITHEQWVTDRLDGRRKLWEITMTVVHGDDAALLGVLGVAFDVTDRETTYRELVDETQRFEAAERLADTGSWDEDVLAGTSRWTPGLFRIFGLDPATTVPDRSVIARLIHPDDRDAVLRATEEGRRHGRPYVQEYRAIVDGRTKYIAARGYPKLGVDGQLIRVTGTVQDVTDRHAAEAAVEASAARHAALMDLTIDGFAVYDADGVILEVNDVYCEISGYTQDELIGWSVTDLRPPEAREPVSGLVDLVRTAGSVRFDTVHQRKDGSLWPVEVSSSYSPIEGGRFFSYLRDLTEEHERAEALQQAADDWSTLLAGTGDGFVRVDRQGRILEVSESFTTLIGRPAETLVGRTMADINPYLDDDELRAGMDAFAAAGGGVVPGVVRHADGDDIPVEISVVFTERNGGQFFTFVRDERERLRLGAEVEQAAHRYQALVDHTPDGFLRVRLDGTIFETNDRAAQMFGVTTEELLGRSVADLNAERSPEATRAILAGIPERGHTEIETRARRSDGTTFPVRIDIMYTPVDGDHLFAFLRELGEPDDRH